MRMFALALAFVFSIAPAFAADRVALVIGNDAYRFASPLKNAVADATAVATMFTNMDFLVSSGLDLDEAEMRRVITEFTDAAKSAKLVAVYYAGHGVMVRGEDIMLPVDFDPGKQEAALANAITLSHLATVLEGSSAQALFFIDTNRTSPFENAPANGTNGGKWAGPAGGILMSWSTAPGGIALDGGGSSSPYTEGLLKFLPVAGQDVQAAVMQVRRHVFEATKGEQTPFDYSRLQKPVILKQ